MLARSVAATRVSYSLVKGIDNFQMHSKLFMILDFNGYQHKFLNAI